MHFDGIEDALRAAQVGLVLTHAPLGGMVKLQRTAPLPRSTQHHLRRLVLEFGDIRAAQLLGVSRQSVLRGLARLDIRAGVAESITTGLAARVAESIAPGLAARDEQDGPRETAAA